MWRSSVDAVLYPPKPLKVCNIKPLHVPQQLYQRFPNRAERTTAYMLSRILPQMTNFLRFGPISLRNMKLCKVVVQTGSSSIQLFIWKRSLISFNKHATKISHPSSFRRHRCRCRFCTSYLVCAARSIFAIVLPMVTHRAVMVSIASGSVSCQSSISPGILQYHSLTTFRGVFPNR